MLLEVLIFPTLVGFSWDDHPSTLPVILRYFGGGFKAVSRSQTDPIIERKWFPRILPTTS
jgi:hypothetical protein